MRAVIRRDVALPKTYLPPTKPVRAKSSVYIPLKEEMVQKKNIGPWTETETAKAVRMWNEGMHLQDIAEELGRSKDAVRIRINQNRYSGEVKSRSRKWTPQQEQILTELVESGCDFDEISVRIGKTRGAVRKHWQHMRKEKSEI